MKTRLESTKEEIDKHLNGIYGMWSSMKITLDVMCYHLYLITLQVNAWTMGKCTKQSEIHKVKNRLGPIWFVPVTFSSLMVSFSKTIPQTEIFNMEAIIVLIQLLLFGAISPSPMTNGTESIEGIYLQSFNPFPLEWVPF